MKKITTIFLILFLILTCNVFSAEFITYDIDWTGNVDDDWNNADNYTDEPTNRDRIFIDISNLTGNEFLPKITDISNYRPSSIIIRDTLIIENNLEFLESLTDVNILTVEDNGVVYHNNGEIFSDINSSVYGEYHLINGRLNINNLNIYSEFTMSNGELHVYGNLNVNNTAQFTQEQGDIHVYGNLNINDTTQFTQLNGNIYIYGDLNVNDIAQFTQLNGDIYFIGNNVHNIDGENIFNNITVNSDEVNIISGEQKVFGNIIIENGIINTNNLLTIASNENKTGSIGPIQPTMIQGEVKVERYISNNTSLSNDWRFLGSPVQGQTLENWNDNMLTSGFPGADYSYPGPNIMWYDETLPGTKDERWVTPSDISDPIIEGQGYAVYMGSESIKVDVQGNINSGNFDFPVSYSNNMDEDNDGWNLISNPYPSSINWDSPEWVKENISDAIWIWNPEVGQFATYINGSSVNGGSNLIASSQAFWVKANTNSPSLSITENAKSLEDHTFLKNDENNDIHITLSNGSMSDEIIIKHVEDITLDYNSQYDAYNLGSYVSNVSLYTEIDNHQYAIKTIDINENVNIEIAALTPTSGEFDLTFENIDSAIPDNICIILEDQFIDETYDLRSTQQISVNLSDTTSIPRFKISFIKSFDYNLTHIACHGDSTGSISLDLDTSNWDITWEHENEIISSENSISNLGPGTYNYHVEDSSLATCNSFQGELIIEDADPIEVLYTIDQPECIEDSGSIYINDVLNMNDNLIFNWSNIDSDDIHIIDNVNLLPGMYNLTITDDNNCEYSNSFEIEEGLNIEAKFILEKDTFFVNENINFYNYSINSEQYLWDFDNNSYSNQSQPTIVYEEEGIYKVALTAINNNCESTYKKEVIIEKKLTSINSILKDNFSIRQDSENIMLDINLNFPEKLSINLTNTVGQKVKIFNEKEYLTDIIKINTSNLSNGIYFLQIHSNENSIVFKLKI